MVKMQHYLDSKSSIMKPSRLTFLLMTLPISVLPVYPPATGVLSIYIEGQTTCRVCPLCICHYWSEATWLYLGGQKHACRYLTDIELESKYWKMTIHHGSEMYATEGGH